MATLDEAFWTSVVVPILSGPPERAIPLLREQLSRAPSPASRDWIQLAIGNIYAANLQHGEASREFRAIVTRGETELASSAQLAIAVSHIMQDDEVAAIRACQDLLRLFPHSKDRLRALSWLCYLARRRGDHDLLASTMSEVAKATDGTTPTSQESTAPARRDLDIDLCIATGRLQDAICLLESAIDEERVHGGDVDAIAILEARIAQIENELRRAEPKSGD